MGRRSLLDGLARALGLGQHIKEYLVPTYDRPRCLIKIVPTKMLTWDGVEWAKRYTDTRAGLAGA